MCVFYDSCNHLCEDKRFNIMGFLLRRHLGKKKRSQHTIAEKHKQSGLLDLFPKTQAVPNVFYQMAAGFFLSFLFFSFFLSSRNVGEF